MHPRHTVIQLLRLVPCPHVFLLLFAFIHAALFSIVVNFVSHIINISLNPVTFNRVTVFFFLLQAIMRNVLNAQVFFQFNSFWF